MYNIAVFNTIAKELILLRVSVWNHIKESYLSHIPQTVFLKTMNVKSDFLFVCMHLLGILLSVLKMNNFVALD